jgi:probable addiction module antidote protein
MKKAVKKQKMTYTVFSASDYLDSEEMISAFLTEAAQDGNPAILLRALAEVAKARGMTQVAKDAGLGRESLYKALAPGAKPRYETVAVVIRALKVKIVVAAA